MSEEKLAHAIVGCGWPSNEAKYIYQSDVLSHQVKNKICKRGVKLSKDTTGAHAVFVTLGASNHGDTEREHDDYYATDPKALELLLELESFSQEVWEPACGGGHLSKVLEKHGFHVRSTDLIDRGYGEGGIDFLQTKTSFDGDIITNPPYKYALEFVEHSIQCVNDGHKVAMLLRLNFLEGKARRQLFENYPPPAWCTLQQAESTVARMAISVRRRGATAALKPMRGSFGRKDTLGTRWLGGLTNG